MGSIRSGGDREKVTMNAGLGAGTARSRSPGQSLTGRQLSLVERPRKEGVRAKHCLTYAFLTD